MVYLFRLQAVWVEHRVVRASSFGYCQPSELCEPGIQGISGRPPQSSRIRSWWLTKESRKELR